MSRKCADLAPRSVPGWTPVVVDVTPVRLLLVALAGWLKSRQEEAVADLVEA